MNKTKTAASNTAAKQQAKGKYHEKFHIDATFEDAVKLLITTPKKKLKKS